MINLVDINKAKPTLGQPTKKPMVVDHRGRIIPFDSKTPALDYVADIQTAPDGARHIPILCASGLMYEAIRLVKRDPKFKGLGRESREAVIEALTAAE